MKRVFLSIALAVLGCGVAKATSLSEQLSSYDIVWESQSKASEESMPVGGGDVGLNVWVENNELLFYVAQSGTFDENNQMLKHGRVRMSFSPNPFAKSKSFKQTLRVEKGDIMIETDDAKINVWVDAFSPVINVKTESEQPIMVSATYEGWRNKDFVMPYNSLPACMSYRDYPYDVITYHDTIEKSKESVTWFHRNRSEGLVRDFCIEQQGMESYRDSIPDTQTGLTFGGVMSGTNMKYSGKTSGRYIDTDFIGYKLSTKSPVKEHRLKLTLETGQYEELDGWRKALKSTDDAASETNYAAAQSKTRKFWNNFWERSYIFIKPSTAGSPDDKAWQVGRNYQLFRYMLGCNATGEYPSKFNGSLFTYDAHGIEERYEGLNPDFRAWGGGSFTAQNQRLVYWPMLKSGDFEMMPPQFNYYTRTLSAAEARSKEYWGHEGACFTEQLENFGLPFAAGWGFKEGARKRHDDVEWGIQDNLWISYHYVNQLEFSLMILDYYRFTGIDISEYMRFIKSSVRFFDEHYRYRYKKETGNELDDRGKLVIYPSTAAETYKGCKNPTDVVSGMRCVTQRLLELPTKYVSTEEKREYLSLMQRIPELTFEMKEDKYKVVRPAEQWDKLSNQEIPEMYMLFPYGLYGLTKPDLYIAQNTWKYGESKKMQDFTVCWSQVGIFAARLGFVKEASHYVIDKMADAPRRFPTFWGPGPDWVPDVDHGGAGMINLQEMLMQTEGDNILLFPAWDKSWDVKFKMYAPKNTTVEVELKGGEIADMTVTPASRVKDIILM